MQTEGTMSISAERDGVDEKGQCVICQGYGYLNGWIPANLGAFQSNNNMKLLTNR